MADSATRDELVTLVADAIADGDYDATHYANPDDFDGFGVGAHQAVTAMLANPDVVLRALGFERMTNVLVAYYTDGTERCWHGPRDHCPLAADAHTLIPLYGRPPT